MPAWKKLELVGAGLILIAVIVHFAIDCAANRAFTRGVLENQLAIGEMIESLNGREFFLRQQINIQEINKKISDRASRAEYWSSWAVFSIYVFSITLLTGGLLVLLSRWVEIRRGAREIKAGADTEADD